MSPFGDPCGLSGSNYIERYGDVELVLALMGTGTTRSLNVLTAREVHSKRLMFDMRVEVGLDDLMARARRSNRPADDELREIALSYARYLVDTGAFRRAPHFRLQVGVEAEVLEPLETKGRGRSNRQSGAVNDRRHLSRGRPQVGWRPGGHH